MTPQQGQISRTLESSPKSLIRGSRLPAEDGEAAVIIFYQILSWRTRYEKQAKAAIKLPPRANRGPQANVGHDFYPDRFWRSSIQIAWFLI
jgi:hypothetical protein